MDTDEQSHNKNNLGQSSSSDIFSTLGLSTMVPTIQEDPIIETTSCYNVGNLPGKSSQIHPICNPAWRIHAACISETLSRARILTYSTQFSNKPQKELGKAYNTITDYRSAISEVLQKSIVPKYNNHQNYERNLESNSPPKPPQDTTDITLLFDTIIA
ncbi:hypothetical protein C2G38_2165431 [Gigaspora rosea]|uniref:Uncharacterized protein n=1 Tax=Gigaspora rosea TaxID=44941 RepID=A0A397VV38_9GLOM|nr:hypothetical protein C2G38_2165431 [Gigaspora rosea]CAG8469226.1 13411_t:CDS:2 [Gigaspora rosea]